MGKLSCSVVLFPCFALEAVRRFCGDSLYVLRRVKDAANALGVRERAEDTDQNS